MTLFQLSVADACAHDSGGRGRWVYPGATTELTFANGTTLTLQNFARVLAPFDGISTGEQLYQTYFVPPPGEPEEVEEIATQSVSSSSAAMSSSSSSTSSATSTIPAPGYPTPVYREMNNLNVSTYHFCMQEVFLTVNSPATSWKAKATTT